MNRAALISSVLSAIGAFALGWLARDARPAKDSTGALISTKPLEKPVRQTTSVPAGNPDAAPSAITEAG